VPEIKVENAKEEPRKEQLEEETGVK